MVLLILIFIPTLRKKFSRTTINNLQDIFALVDKTSDFSQGEKDKAKGTLETIYDEVTTAGVRLGPFIQLLGSLLPK